MSQFNLRVAIIGYGSIGRQHYRTLTSMLNEPPWVLKIERENKSTNETLLPEASLLRSWKELSTNKIDVVCICNPTSLHVETALAAVEQGCDVFIEKPLSHSFIQIDDLESLLRAKSKLALVGYMMRFHPHIHALKEIIESQNYGRLLKYESYWGEDVSRWHPGEDYRKSYASRKDLGGGVSLTLSHDVDLAYFLLGDLILNERKELKHQLPIDVDQSCELLFQTQVCKDVKIILNYHDWPPQRKISLAFEKAKVDFDYYHSTLTLQTALGSQVMKLPSFQRQRLFRDQFAYFLGCVESRTPPRPSIAEARRVLEFILPSHPIFGSDHH